MDMLTNDGAAEGHERPLAHLLLHLHPGSALLGALNPPISRDAENRAGPPKDITLSSLEDNAVGAFLTEAQNFRAGGGFRNSQIQNRFPSTPFPVRNRCPERSSLACGYILRTRVQSPGPSPGILF